MTDWFARPVLHVSSVEASLRFHVDRLGFTIARAELEGRGAPVKDGHWGYRLLVVGDLDGNQLFFNYPNEPGQSSSGGASV